MQATFGALVTRWMVSHPLSDRLPEWLVPPNRRIDAMPADSAQAAVVSGTRGDIDAYLNKATDGATTTFRQRRSVGERLAGYIEQHGLLSQDHALKLRACRHGGAWGIDTGTGKMIVAWDSKCSMTLLCPHCARTEQRRLVRRYKNPFINWKQANQTRRIHSGVMTWPNVAPGDLAERQRSIFKYFAKVARSFPSIKGHLATVEVPLSSRGDWNLHLNVLLCVEGPLHWGDLRAAWHRKTVHLFPGYEGTGFQISMRQLPRYDDDALDAALRELIKYPAKHVTEKSNGRGSGGAEAVGGGAVSESGALLGVDETRGFGIDDDGVALLDVSRRVPGGEWRGGGRDALPVSGGRCAAGDDRNAEWHAGTGTLERDGGHYGMDAARSDPRFRGDGTGGAAISDGRCGEHGGHDRGGDKGEGQHYAPAMIDWPPERFLEWWEAHRRFRRTRSYGCLFGEALGELSGDIEDRPRGEITWYGRLWWDARSQGYAVEGARPVSLIQANKSSIGDRPPGGRFAQSVGTGGPPQSATGYRASRSPVV